MSKAMSAKPGDVLTKIAIRVVFDPYFERVIIGSHLECLPRENRKAPITYRVKEALPPPEMYRELRNQRFTTTLEDLVSAAQGEVESLGGELRDWHGNLPEGINSSDKASEIDEAASTLENINFPGCPGHPLPDQGDAPARLGAGLTAQTQRRGCQHAGRRHRLPELQGG